MQNKDFHDLVEEFGAPSTAISISRELAATFRGQLPNSLIDFWIEYGIGIWRRGKFQFCRPDHYRPVAELICRNDVDFTKDATHIFGFTAFAEVFLWSEKNKMLRIDLPLLTAQADMIEPPLAQNDDKAIADALHSIADDTTDFFDYSGAPLFERALDRLGELELGECYGFVPALALGGPAQINNLRRMKALEHFAVLAQLGAPQLIDYSSEAEIRTLREIG